MPRDTSTTNNHNQTTFPEMIDELLADKEFIEDLRRYLAQAICNHYERVRAETHKGE